MGDALLDVMLTNKEGLAGGVRAGSNLSCSDHDGRIQELEGREQGKNQDYIPGLQHSRLWCFSETCLE